MLDQPLWPDSRLNLTTPWNLIGIVASIVVGLPLYLHGFTYEGSVLLYMLPGIIFAHPYYSIRFTGYMTWLIMMCFLPVSIWLQNKGVETGAWHYRPHDGYLLWITKPGEGWWRWTRHPWLGNDMPAMEYAFYPLFGLFQMTLYWLYSHVIPRHWYEQRHKALKPAFPVIFLLLFGGFIAIDFFCSKPGKTDYMYWLAGVGYLIVGGTYLVNPNFRDYTQSPVFWIWVVFMGVLFMPVWEFFHVCIDHDWVYDPANTFTFMYTYNNAGVPVSEFFGYLTTAMTFQALILVFTRRFGKVVIRNYELVPFSWVKEGDRPDKTEFKI